MTTSGQANDAAAPAASARFTWAAMSPLQVGRYGEYAAKMAFLVAGFDVYDTEVDERGIDLIARRPDSRFYEVQVKTVRKLNYTFMRKTQFPLRDSMYCSLILLDEGQPPDLFLIPAIAWQEPNAVLVDRNYKTGKSAPEWGINFSRRNLPLLAPYRFEATAAALP